jgi:hypothetical protein
VNKVNAFVESTEISREREVRDSAWAVMLWVRKESIQINREIIPHAKGSQNGLLAENLTKRSARVHELAPDFLGEWRGEEPGVRKEDNSNSISRGDSGGLKK